VEKVFRRFDSLAESSVADSAYYASLTPAQRLEILLELIARHREAQGEAAEGFARVYRVVDLPRR
jgi:hypothetical protein